MESNLLTIQLNIKLNSKKILSYKISLSTKSALQNHSGFKYQRDQQASSRDSSVNREREREEYIHINPRFSCQRNHWSVLYSNSGRILGIDKAKFSRTNKAKKEKKNPWVEVLWRGMLLVDHHSRVIHINCLDCSCNLQRFKHSWRAKQTGQLACCIKLFFYLDAKNSGRPTFSIKRSTILYAKKNETL